MQPQSSNPAHGDFLLMRRLAVAAMMVLLLLPAAAARPEPVLYFLYDDEAPVLPGLMNDSMPSDLEPETRPVLPGSDELPSALFVTSLEDHPGRLQGRMVVGLWTGQSPVLEGNLTAVLYEVQDDERVVLARASVDVHTDPTGIDPTVLVPPDPTDPEGSIAYLQYQALTMLLRPPLLLDLGVLEANVTEGAQLALGIYLEAAPDGVAPMGISSLEYGGQLQPSFVFVPWYAPDPPRATPVSPAPPTAPPTDSHAPAPSPTPEAQAARDSPGLAVALVLVGLAALVLRRR